MCNFTSVNVHINVFTCIVWMNAQYQKYLGSGEYIKQCVSVTPLRDTERTWVRCGRLHTVDWHYCVCLVVCVFMMWYEWFFDIVCMCVFVYVELAGVAEGDSDQTAGGPAETDGCYWLIPQSHHPGCPARKGWIHPWTPGSPPQRAAGWPKFLLLSKQHVNILESL